MNPLPNKIKEDQANKSLEERSFVLDANNFGFWDIDVLRGRHTTLKFFLKMMKRRRRRKKHNLQPKRRVSNNRRRRTHS